jgi:putative transposase
MDKFELVEKGIIKRLLFARYKKYFPGAICHITQRATSNELLFLEEQDYLYILHLLKENVKEFNYSLFCFVLMPNHIHLLLSLREKNLSTAMQSLFTAYAKYFNNKYERRGHLFTGPYRCALCFGESYLFAISVYIHVNPVRAGLVDNPLKYRWSSCKYYLFYSSIKKRSFIEPSFILKILDKDLSHAQQKYKKFLEIGCEIELPNLYENPKVGEIFKTEFFKIIRRKKTKETFLKDIELDLEQIENLESIKNNKRRKEAMNYTIKQLQTRGYSQQEIAKKLGISRMTIYRLIHKNVTKHVKHKM